MELLLVTSLFVCILCSGRRVKPPTSPHTPNSSQPITSHPIPSAPRKTPESRLFIYVLSSFRRLFCNSHSTPLHSTPLVSYNFNLIYTESTISTHAPDLLVYSYTPPPPSLHHRDRWRWGFGGSLGNDLISHTHSTERERDAEWIGFLGSLLIIALIIYYTLILNQPTKFRLYFF